MLTKEYADISNKLSYIDSSLYDESNIKLGLRNKNGTGVVIGITKIANVIGYEVIDGIKIPTIGKLMYRTMEINEIVEKIQNDYNGSFMFEKVTYLLLFGKLPNEKEFNDFMDLIYEYRKQEIDLFNKKEYKKHSLMNALQVGISQLYFLDDTSDLIDTENIIIHSLKIIARMPEILLQAYMGNMYNSARARELKAKKISTSQFILEMLGRGYTDEEVKLLDLCLIVHAEHGGGNNSTFTVRVVSSAYTDTYSSIIAGISSLKGLRHGGANIRVLEMIRDIQENVAYDDKVALKNYLYKIYNKEAFDKTGLIYGMGHAIYTKSDPRALLLKERAKALAEYKNIYYKYEFYENIEELTKEIFKEQRGSDFEICSNVDLYSGFIYEMLNLRSPIFTPLFTLSRTSGWCAHRLEQIISDKKILRPAYKTCID